MRTPLFVVPLLAALVAAQAPTPTPTSAPTRLTLEQTIGRGARVEYVTPPPPVRWAPDGKHLLRGEEWLEPLTGNAVARPETRTESRPARGGARRRGPGRAELPADAGAAREVQPSPDAKRTAFVRDHNLQVYEAATKETWAVTSDGAPTIRNGILDWVYQEEVYGRGNFRGHWWSPDSRKVAFLRLDETAVKDFTVIDHVPAPLDKDKTVKVEVEKYPKAGDPNPTCRLAIAHADARRVVWADLGAFPADLLVVRVGWTPDARQLVCQIQDRIQTWLDLCYVDPESGKVQRILHEESPTWVNVLEEPRWLADGTFLWVSERTGYKHLYHHAADGKLLHAVTAGEWEFRSIERLDEANGIVWFHGGKDSAIANNLYRVRLDGSDLTRITKGDGSHQVEWNGDATLLLDTVSSVATPPVIRLCRADGTLVRELGASQEHDLQARGFSRPELLELKARDGFGLDAVLIRPVPLDTSARYALWIETYSGPDAPSVSNSFRASAWAQFLAQQGIASLQVNVRTASQKGRAIIGKLYKNFGAQELADLEDAIADLARRHPWIDTDRVGITGWSYGGFMTAYALTHSKAFRLGIAGAGVYDWRLYDTIYTERYMSTPELNPEGYRQSSCLEAAKDLHGHLVLLHGTMDDNVHLQNCMRMVYELQKADKDFELMLYPRSRHGVGSAAQNWQMRKLIWKQIETHLGAPK